MSCEQFEEQVSAYIDHELSDDETEMLFEHLAGCASCRRAMTAVLDLRSGLRDRAPLLAPKELDDRVLSMARSAQLRMPDRVAIPAKMWQRRISMRISALVAAVLMIIAASSLLALVWGPVKTTPPQIQTVYITALPPVEVHGYMP